MRGLCVWLKDVSLLHTGRMLSNQIYIVIPNGLSLVVKMRRVKLSFLTVAFKLKSPNFTQSVFLFICFLDILVANDQI